MTRVLNRRDLYDASAASRYRNTDEQILDDPECERTRTRLRELSTCPGRALQVLDVGCGTGRWFHSYENVERLVGIDTSPEMLARARTPVCAHQITAQRIDLECTDVFSLDVDDGTFDLIVAIGVFGQHAVLNDRVCARFAELLSPGGHAFFTVVDATSMPTTLRRRLVDVSYPRLPGILKRTIDARRRTFFMKRDALDRLLDAAPFEVIDVTRRVSRSNNWLGAYFECLVRRGA